MYKVLRNKIGHPVGDLHTKVEELIWFDLFKKKEKAHFGNVSFR